MYNVLTHKAYDLYFDALTDIITEKYENDANDNDAKKCMRCMFEIRSFNLTLINEITLLNHQLKEVKRDRLDLMSKVDKLEKELKRYEI